VIGTPSSACRTKRGTTMPYRPVWRGPIVLKNRRMVTGNWYSWWYASARNSSIAFEHA
jgi:hypothetical protein